MTTKAARDRIRATLTLLSDKFPNAFRRRRPLKLGIHRDLAVALGDTVTPATISQALHFYVTHPAYLQATTLGAVRIDLSGQPAGVVTSAEALDAILRLQQIKQLLKTPPPQARDGLAALRQAGARRRKELRQ